MKPEAIVSEIGALSAAYATCADITRRRGPNFSVGFELLPDAKRRAVHASYAFCRLVDDLVDELPAGAPVGALLQRWRDELAAVYGGQPAHPVARALADAVRRFPVPRRAFDDLIRGCEQDLVFAPPVDLSGVRRYCDLVATPIGEISLAVFGTVGPSARTLARHLAHALQWTNIVRDVAEDADRDRVYVPLQWWREEGIRPQDLRRPACRTAVVRVLRRAVTTAGAHYDAAQPLAGRVAPDARATVAVMTGVYRSILARIEAHPERVLHERVALTEAEKSELQRRYAAGGGGRSLSA